MFSLLRVLFVVNITPSLRERSARRGRVPFLAQGCASWVWGHGMARVYTHIAFCTAQPDSHTFEWHRKGESVGQFRGMPSNLPRRERGPGAHVGAGLALFRDIVEHLNLDTHLPGKTVSVESLCRIELRRLLAAAEPGKFMQLLQRCVKVGRKQTPLRVCHPLTLVPPPRNLKAT